MTLPRLPEARVPSPAINQVAGSVELQQSTGAATGEVIPLVYGRQRMGARIFAVSQLSGDLVLGVLWCLGEIQAIELITADGKTLPAAVTVTSYTGTTTQGVDPTLASALVGYADTMVGSYGGYPIGIAYSVLRIPPTALLGFPRLEAVIQGRTLYDPRTNLADYSKIDLVSSDGLHCFRTFNVYPTLLAADWRRCPRDDGSGGILTAIRWNSTISGIANGTTLVMACDFRHDGTTCSFVLSAYYDSAYHNVTPTITDLGDGTFRAVATHTVSTATTTTVRFFNLRIWSTDGTYLDLRSITLAIGTEDPGYIQGPVTAAGTRYSRNPALALADWIGNDIYGQGLALDWGYAGRAAAACDEVVEVNESKSPIYWPRRALDLVLDSEQPVAQWADVLRTYAGCFIVHAGDAVRLVPDRPAPTSRALTAADVVEGSLRLQRRGLRERPTVVTVTYTDIRSTPWAESRVSVALAGVSTGWGARREEVVALPGITDRAQAYREATERLNAATLTDLEAAWATFDEGIADLVGDVVTLTHPIGLTAQTFRLTDVRANGPGRWAVTAQQYDVDVYSDSILAPAEGDYTLWPDPSQIGPPTDVACASGTDHLLIAQDGTIVSRIYVTWTRPSDPYYDDAEVEFQEASAAYTKVARNYGALLQAGASDDDAYCAPVRDGVLYQVRVRARNTLGVVSDWAYVTHTVVGKTAAPEPPTSFLVGTYADGTRRFTWSPPDPEPTDLAGYLLRYRLGSGYTWGDLYALHSGVLTASPYESNALAAGTYTFGLVSVDTTGNVSSAVYIEAELPDPRLAGVIYAEEPHLDGWPDTKTNGWIDPAGWLVATDTDDWADLTAKTWATWTTWTQTPKTLTYETAEIDLGFLAVFTVLVSAVGDGTITLQERHSDDDITWSSYATISGTPVSARYVQIKATASGSAGTVVRLETLSILLDAEPVLQDISDLATSSLTGSYRIGTGDVRLPLIEDFNVIRAVFVTLQNVGAGWSWELIDKTTTYGPRIKIYNASNTLADATIDAHIRGL